MISFDEIYIFGKNLHKATILKTEVPTNDANLSLKGKDNFAINSFFFLNHTFSSYICKAKFGPT